MATAASRREEKKMPDRLLSIYLNDHLGGATLGVELSRRVGSSHDGSDERGRILSRIRAEIEADRATLERLTDRLGVRRSPVKPATAWAAEKLGRLKLNGRLRGYSPLSRVVELEGLGIAITGKIQLWNALERTLGQGWEGFDFRDLAERAERQRGAVEALHRGAVAAAFSPADRD